MADTLKQVQMDRQQMIENNKGATETSRAALSAISGRNVLKTKTETAKMRRNEEIAAQQNAAAIAANAATGAVTMEKAKASAAQRQDHTRRGEVLSMLNMGIYEDSFAATLGMPADVVKGAANRKAAEIAQKKAAQAAAAQAQADYAKALADLQNAQNQKWKADNDLSKAQKQQIEEAINSFDDGDAKTVDANEAKEKILESSGVEDDLIVPWKENDPLGSFDLDLVRRVRAVAQSKSIAAPAVAKAIEEENKELENSAAQRVENLKRATAYYDRKLAEAVQKKEEASEALSALEESFKKTPEGILAILRYSVDAAETDEDRVTAYQEYAKRLDEVTRAVALSATVALMDAEEKYSNVETFDEEGRKNLDSQKERLQQVKTALERELKEEDLTIEFQDGLNETIKQIDEMIAGLDGAIEYADHYEEIKGDLTYKKLDVLYHHLSVDEIEAIINMKNDKKVSVGDRRGSGVELIKAQNARVDAEVAELKSYLEQRKEKKKEEEIDARAEAYFADAPAGTLTQKYLYLYNTAGEQRNELLVDIATGGGTTAAAVVEKRKLSNAMTGPYDEMRRDLSQYFHNNIISYSEGLFSTEELEQYAAGGAKAFVNRGINPDGGEGFLYEKGLDGVFEGNYGDFYIDVPGFMEGEYGDFSAEEGKRVLAIMDQYGVEDAFAYYAAVKEQVLLRKAEKQPDIVSGLMGQASGLTNFLRNGGTMIGNALTGSYARVGGDIMTASHQVTMDRLENMGIGGDALELLYMSGYSAIDMVPAVALSFVPYVGGYLSSAYTFSKVMATTYNDSIVQGKRADEALTFSVLSAAAEVTMEKILGGVGQLGTGSGFSAKLKDAIGNLSATKGMKTALKVASSMGSEGFEELLQEAVSPFLQKVAADLNGISDAELEEIDWEEAAKSFFVGAAVGGIFDGFSSINSNRNNGMKITEAEALLESGEVAKLIKGAADLGSIRAKQIMDAYNNGQALYEGKEGWFAYASPADIVNIKQSYKRRSARESLRRLKGEFERIGTDKAEARSFTRLFKKVLNGETLTTQEAAEIINHEDAKAVFEKMLGMDITMMLPNELAALARLAAFAENGKISNERLVLFRDAFGELDYKALAEIIKYSDMADKKVSGIIYEDPSVESQLTEAEQESVDVLKILSQETGMVFLVTDQHQTGDYLAAGLMAVNRNEISRGVFNSINHRAYYMAKQLLAEKGVDLKTFMLNEAKRIKGDEAVEAEIKNIQQQSAVDANDVDPKTAEDELCARMMGEIISQEGALDRIAETDIELAEVLRKAIGAVQEHLDKEMQLKLKNKVSVLGVSQNDVDAYVDKSISKENEEDIKSYSVPSKRLLHDIGNEIDISEHKHTLRDNDIRHIFNSHGEKTNEKYPVTPDDVKSIPYIVENYDKVFVKTNAAGKPGVVYVKVGKDNVVYYVEAVTEEYHNEKLLINKQMIKTGIDEIPNLHGLEKAINKKESSSQYLADLKQIRKAYVQDVKENYSVNSITNFKENVNTVFYSSFFSKGSTETTAFVDNLTKLIKQKRADENGWGTGAEEPFDPDAYDDHDFTYSDAEQVRAQNNGADSVRNFEEMTLEEREAVYADLQGEIDAYITDVVLQEQIEREEASRKNRVSDATERVGAKREREKKTVGEWIKEGWNYTRRKLLDSGQAIYDIGKKIKDDYLYSYYNMARASQQTGVAMISKWQTDVTGKVVGKSLQEIWAPINAKGRIYAKDFDRYLLHLHNIDRMSRYDPEALEEARNQYELEKACLSEELAKMSDDEIRALAHDRDSAYVGEARDYINALDHYNHMRNIKDKPVFGYNVTAEDSRAAAENLERLHPEFKEHREAVYQYIDQLLQYRVDSGLISAETKALLKKTYPHYVPTARVPAEGQTSQKKHWWQREKNREQISKTIGRAEGGDSDIISLYDQIAGQTMSVVREGAKNRLGMRLLQNSERIDDILSLQQYSDKLTDPLLIDRHLDEIDPFMTVKNENIFAVLKDGALWEMKVTKELWEAVNALDKAETDDNVVLKFLKWNTDTFKRLITSLNPMFLVRNLIKDFADGLFYSKDTKRWLAAMPTAIKEMKNGGDLWRQYVALGGGFSTYFDFATMSAESPKGIGKVTGRIEALNQAIEQIPRFAEFIATVRKGDGSLDNLMEAMHNAADITTNFGRSGSAGQWLNRYLIPFFNPSVQGMSKAVRAWTEQRSVKGFVALGAKAVFFGIAPAVINALLYWDDEEWDMIKQTDKDRYFLFKLKDGLWVRIPKGRMLSVFGGIGDRALQAIDGEGFEWASLIQTTVEQMAPSNPIESNILGPLFLASINRTWYGSEIVGQRLKNEPDAEQYDTKTDELSKWIGSVTGLSPKKVHYVLDAYGGVVADVLLPALTPAAERSVFAQAVTLDTNYSNRLSGDFYDKLDELSDQKNSVKATVEDAVVYRWWNRNADTVSDVNAEIRKIEEDQSLTAKEIKEKVNEQYVIRNAAMLGFEENYDRYCEAVKKYSKKAAGMSEDDAKEYIYREANREIFGTEYALKASGTAIYERAVNVRDEQGIDFDTFYDVYFDAKEADVEKCFSLIENGFEKETALEIARNIGALEPLDGEKSVSSIQKYGAIDAADITEDEKLWAMSVLASDADQCKMAISADYNVSLGQFISVKEKISLLDEKATGTKGISNAKVAAAISQTDGLSSEQKAVLWQLFTGSTSAKNNPYSVSIGWDIVAKNKAYKAAQEE